jgi:hypothetical protein
MIRLLVQLRAGDTGFDRRIEILRANPQYLVHPRQIDGYTAVNSIDLPFDRSPRPERNHGNLVPLADLQNFAHLGGRGGKTYQVRPGGRMVRLAVTVLLPNRLCD